LVFAQPGLETHALADEFAIRDVNPLILTVVHMKRCPAVRLMLSRGKHIYCKPPLGIRGTNHLR
jgi:hypothetical protein